MNPGATTIPFASIVVVPVSGDSDTMLILPPRMPTLRTASRPDSGSITRPLEITTSYLCTPRLSRWGVDFIHAGAATASTIPAIGPAICSDVCRMKPPRVAAVMRQLAGVRGHIIRLYQAFGGGQAPGVDHQDAHRGTVDSLELYGHPPEAANVWGHGKRATV